MVINYENLIRYNPKSLVGTLHISPKNYTNGIEEFQQVVLSEKITLELLEEIFNHYDSYVNQQVVKDPNRVGVCTRKKMEDFFLDKNQLRIFILLYRMKSFGNYFTKRVISGKTTNTIMGLNTDQIILLLKDYITILKDNKLIN